jgi:hypothetical protein
MTTATSTRVKTEFLVSQNTSSKELFDQLNELKAGKGANADIPIRAYEKGRKGITLKIYKKKSSTLGELKAALNPKRLDARVLVITTIEEILAKESAKPISTEDVERFNTVLQKIRKKKETVCPEHDIRIRDLTSDLILLKPIWDKTSANSKPTLPPSPTTALPTQKTESPKETKAEKSKVTKTTKKSISQANVAINPTKIKNKSSVPTSEKPNLKIKQTDFDLSSAINFLSKIQKYGENFDIESNSKTCIRVGEIKDTNKLSFYVSTKNNRKSKKTDRVEERRRAENKTTTTNRAITMLKAIADSLVDQNRLNAAGVKEFFSMIEKKRYISVNDTSVLLDLLETGRRAVYLLPVVVQADSDATQDASSILNINSNPFDEVSVEGGDPKRTLPPSKDISSNPFENVTAQENNAATTPTSIKKVNTVGTQATLGERITNRLNGVPTKETQTPTPAPPTYFQRVAEFFKPVTNFFSSVRRFFGFK